MFCCSVIPHGNKSEVRRVRNQALVFFKDFSADASIYQSVGTTGLGMGKLLSLTEVGMDLEHTVLIGP